MWNGPSAFSADPPTALLAATAITFLFLWLLWPSRTRRRCRRYFAGKTVWVTGASSGIGEALARLLGTQLGAHVILSARRVPQLQQLVHEIRAAGGRADCVALDASLSYDDIRRVVSQVAAAGVQVAVLNAGVNHGGEAFAALDAQQIDNVLNVNLRGTMFAAHALLTEATALQCIAVISSLAAYRGLPGSTVYGATKAALCSFVDGLRMEMRHTSRTPVHLMCVCPGFVRTPAIEHRQHPKPFLMEAEMAAWHIADAVSRQTAHYGFPWVMEQLVMRIARRCPRALYETVVGRAWHPPR